MLCFFSNDVRKNDNYKGLTNKGFARILPGKGIVFKVIGKISGVKLQLRLNIGILQCAPEQRNINRKHRTP